MAYTHTVFPAQPDGTRTGRRCARGGVGDAPTRGKASLTVPLGDQFKESAALAAEICKHLAGLGHAV